MLPPEGGIPEHEEVDEIPFEDEIVETPLPVITESSTNSASAASVTTETTVTTNTTIEDHRIKMQEAWARRFQNLNKKEDE
jgi:hypothetical protein